MTQKIIQFSLKNNKIKTNSLLKIKNNKIFYYFSFIKNFLFISLFLEFLFYNQLFIFLTLIKLLILKQSTDSHLK